MNSHSDDYGTARADFHDAVSELVRMSATIGGSPSKNGRQYWSSVLAAKMTLNAMTLDKIVPRVASAGSEDLWDISSIAALVRVFAESYLLFHWLCVETETTELWDFRITALTIADNRARYRLTQEVEGEPEPSEFTNAQENLAKHLDTIGLFHGLSPQRQKDLRKGAKSPFVQDDVLDRLNLDRGMFRRFYRYLSSFVHTGTVSFFRVEEHGRGNGEFNEYEATMVLGCLHFMIELLQCVVREMRRLH